TEGAESRSGYPQRDARGRRLRASAHRGRRVRTARGGDDLRAREQRGALPVVAKATLVVVVALAAFLGSSAGYISYASNLPDAHDLTMQPLPNDTLVYASDGSLMADLHPAGIEHYQQPLKQMGTWLPEATVAIEDSGFWTEPGINPFAIARAAYGNWRAQQITSGASTITQQLVKVRLLQNSDQTYSRKIKEAILALQVEHMYSKSQILQMYLNTVEYGNNAEGTQAAAQNYFRVNTSQLTLAQASMLAGLPRNPNLYNPLANYATARYRQHQVLQAMVKQKMITQQQATQAYAVTLQPQLQLAGASIDQDPAFVDWVAQELAAKFAGGSIAAIETAGLRVTTTFSPTLQSIAQNAITQNVNANLRNHEQQGAMVSIDPATGGVTAMVGSAFPDRWGGQYNYATDVPRHPGSSFKIFTYTAAIQSKQYTMVTPIPDQPIDYVPESYRPLNYDPTSFPSCVLQTCMGNSYNIPAVYTELSLGVPTVVDEARTMGANVYAGHTDANGNAYWTTTDAASSFGASLTLGGYYETPLDMAVGAATLADLGVYHPPTGIEKVTSAGGALVYQLNPAAVAKQVVSPQVAYIMATIMSNDQNRQAMFGPGSPLTVPGHTVASKDGTAENFTDGWVVGYTPSIATAFWFGNQSESVSLGNDAVYVAAPGWQKFMEGALAAMNVPANQWYTPPSGLVQQGNHVWLLPGTSESQKTPSTPSGLVLSGPPSTGPRTTTPAPGGNGNGNGHGNGHGNGNGNGNG
ncbi:MAG: transglycosylase domain-containing protein, partial [Candidatus Dormiibacterota bacterium]